MALLEIKNLKIHYQTSKGTNKAVDGLSFSLEEGTSIGLVGESGCGKSTLVKGIIQVMPGNAEISQGEILYNGEDLLQVSKKRLKAIQWTDISLIPQASMDSLNPVYRVKDSFLEILRLKGGMSKKEAMDRMSELFKMVGLDPNRAEHYPHEFSGGMKQRAIIALALALNPKVVIADEPVTALDVIVQNQILQELKELRNRLGLSMILITHDISVVAQTCDEIAVMYAGKIVERGSAENVLLNPIHPYTMGLKNAFPSLGDSKRDLISIEGSPPLLIDPPAGCRFEERCPFKQEKCGKEEPMLIEMEVGHYSACHFSANAKEMSRLAGEVATWKNVI